MSNLLVDVVESRDFLCTCDPWCWKRAIEKKLKLIVVHSLLNGTPCCKFMMWTYQSILFIKQINKLSLLSAKIGVVCINISATQKLELHTSQQNVSKLYSQTRKQITLAAYLIYKTHFFAIWICLWRLSSPGPIVSFPHCEQTWCFAALHSSL